MAPMRSVDPAAHERQLVARFRRATAIEALALALLLLLCAPVASAETFTNVFFFGASGEDTGIFTPTHADAQLGLGLVSSYGYDPDRWTNAGGTVWAEPFAAALGHSATSRARGGTNYATGGGGPGGTAAQIDQFSADHAGIADPDALYYIFLGGDALLQAASPSSAVSEMLLRIDQLRALGATHFLIPNFPDYGPFAPGAGPLGPIQPIPPNATAWATAYASELSAALSTLSGVTIYQLDLKGLLDPIFADPAGHGFSAGLTLCVEVPDCRAGIGVDEYVMFDHLHPTSATHDLWAQAALALIPAACSNGVDEDGDGRIDFGSDPGCASAEDTDELSSRQCDDGIDNDGDGWVDWRGDSTGDPHCADLSDESETGPPACSDGVDNDFDGRIDFDSDPGCASADDPNEGSRRQCDNGIDDDLDGEVDWRGDGTGDPHCKNVSDKSEFPPPPRVEAPGRPLRVTTLDDELNDDGDCSLREAIQAANTDAAVDACPAGSGADAIRLRAGIYILGTGQLTITSELIIRGAGNGATVVDAAQLGRVFLIDAGTVELSRLTIQNGRALFDGGILNYGSLTLSRSTVRSNTAERSNGGISNYGTMAIVDSFVVNNAAATDFDGGIFNAAIATLIIDRSTVSGNTATRNNGGIVNLGAMEMVDSTVSGNTAGESVGGIANLGTMSIVDSSVSDNTATGEFNGGIFNAAGARLTLVNSSVSGNIANLSNGGIANQGTMDIVDSSVVDNIATSEFNGGIFNDAGAKLTLVNSTVSGNTANLSNGAIFSFGALGLVNSTVSGNTTSSGVNGGIFGGAGSSVTLKGTVVTGNEGRDCTGSITSGGHNLDSDNTCNLTAAGDLPAVDPMLGPLADNGGPTETHALLPGSPAIDAIAVADCTDLEGAPVVTDQRGVARPKGAGCDIGAFERDVGDD